ncbi:hypothetical protein [Lacipirellula parvula]|uniref:EamA domain-containing protein n=1 Tax=Lacipirellula parvula TaxID=2650471 RepID=A0A5K7XMB0_9BACT|nr:hypothetical protein [Lacipirellula parvula]BBO35723.1 hypothetical protein PLANPX_5335 [Lacipirellula parvula]
MATALSAKLAPADDEPAPQLGFPPVPAATPLTSIICFIVAAFLGAVGQFLYKSGAAAANSGWLSYLLNAKLAGGVACYIAVMVLFVAAFKQGGSLLVLYPIYASTFIWAALIAWRFEGATISAVNVLGMLVLIAGMFLLGWKS